MNFQIRPMAFSGVTRRAPEGNHDMYPLLDPTRKGGWVYADGADKDKLVAADRAILNAMEKAPKGHIGGDYFETDASRAAMKAREALHREIAAKATDEPNVRPLKNAAFG